jgi:hypothetical protein
LVAEGNGIRVYVHRTHFVRQKHFALEDHHYLLKVASNKNTRKVPLLKDVIDVLKISLVKIVKWLQEDFDEVHRNQIYLTITDPSMLSGGINSGNYNLHDPAETTIDEVLSYLKNYLNSKQEIKVSKGFGIWIKVLSVSHITHRLNNGKIVLPQRAGAIHHDAERCSNLQINETRKSLFRLPNDQQLQNLCLPACIILGYYRSCNSKFRYDKSQKSESKIYEKIRNIKKKSNSKCAIEELVHLITIFCENVKLPKDGPFDVNDLLEKASNFYNVQIHIYSNEGNKLRLSVPNKFDESRPQIFLYEVNGESSNAEIAHISLILSVKALFKNSRYTCCICGQMCNVKWRHKCRNKKITCFACGRRSVYSKKTYINKENQRDLCIKISDISKEVCDMCSVITQNENCKEFHKKANCNKGFFCKDCKKFCWKKKKAMSMDTFRLQHNCQMRKCKLCYEQYDEDNNHLCSVRGIKEQSFIPNLAFVHITYLSNDDVAMCDQCFVKEKQFICDKKLSGRPALTHLFLRDGSIIKEIRCKNHQSSEAVYSAEKCPNSATLLFEDTVHEKFSLVTFCDPKLESTMDGKLQKQIINISYLPSYQSHSPLELGKQYSGFKKVHPEDNRENTIHLSYSVAEKLISFLMCRQFQNYSVMASIFDLDIICRQLFLQGFSPNIITQSGRIQLIEVSKYNIRFLAYEVFGISVQPECDSCTIFPQRFNRRENYDYEGLCPDSKHFMAFNDSEDIIHSKSEIVSKMQRENYIFNFKDQLLNNANAIAECIAQGCCNFLKNSFSLQKKLSIHFHMNMKNFLLHPFGKPFCSISSYIFGSWRFFELPKHDLRIVKDEKGSSLVNSSALEQEFVLYRQFQFGQTKEMQSHYTSPKVPKFGRIIPDYYLASDSKRPELSKVGWFHGCIYHGDLINKNCHVVPPEANEDTKNCFNVTYGELAKKFENQQKELVSKHRIPMECQDVMYQCQWERLKKFPLEDLSESEKVEAVQVRDFMQNVYRKRPSNRLAVRTALRGGKSEMYEHLWIKNQNDNESMFILDANSFYGSCAFSHEFPIGKYDTIIRKDELDKITFLNGKCYILENGEYSRIMGIAHVKILAPHTRIPYLPYR